MGTAGLLLVVLFCGFIGYHLHRAIRASRPRICLASIGLAYGLLAVVLHSFTDFGQHLPAIAALSALACGVVINLSRLATFEPASKRHKKRLEPDPPPAAVPAPRFGWAARPAMVALSLLLVLGTGWTAQMLNRTRISAAHADRAVDLAAELQEDGQKSNPGQWNQVLAEAAAARDLVPDGVNYRYALNCYRWQMISSQARAAGVSRWDPSSLESVRQIVSDLHAARALCPTYGPNLAVAGQLELTILGEPGIGNAHIQAGYALAPANPSVCFAAAMADAQGKHWDAATAKFRRTLELDPSMFQQITGELINRYHRADLAIAIAQGKAEWLLSLASNLRQQPLPGVDPSSYTKPLADALLDLKARGVPDDAPPWILHQMSEVCEEQHDLSAAIDYERRAVNLEYGTVWFHLRLATLLDKEGKTMQAVDQARICLRLEPQLAPARQMLGELALRPDFIPTE
jgi:tetratricopeptide (TPR) repeat protein